MQVRKLLKKSKQYQRPNQLSVHRFQEQGETWEGGSILGQWGWAVGQSVWEGLLAPRLEGEGEKQICNIPASPQGTQQEQLRQNWFFC